MKRKLLPLLFILCLLVSSLGIYPGIEASAKAAPKLKVKIGNKNVTKKTYKLKKGKKAKVKINLKSVKKVTYKSSKKKVATISKKGVIKAKSTGTTKITVAVKPKKGKTKKTWFKIKVIKRTTEKPTSAPTNTPVPQKKVKVTFAASYGGSINCKTEMYTANTKIKMTASPLSGYKFSKWVVSTGGKSSEINGSSVYYTVPNTDSEVTAVFVSDAISKYDENVDTINKAMKSVTIKYAAGDYSGAVTKDVELVKSFETSNGKVLIEWSSDQEDIVNSEGCVTCPKDMDRIVNLKATFTIDKISQEKTYAINVIKELDINVNEIKEHTLLDLEKVNEDSEYPLDYELSADKETLSFLSGSYSDIPIVSQKSALMAVYSVKTLLGLGDPSSELECVSVNHDDYSLTYAFRQMYKGIPVYGTGVVINADARTNEAKSLSSTIINSAILESSAAIYEEYYEYESEHEENFKVNYPNVMEKELKVYCMKGYENSPILVYTFKTESDTVIVNALTLEVISKITNSRSWGDYSTTGSGKDEFGNEKTFPVQFHQVDWWFYYLEDTSRNIKIHGDDSSVISKEFNTTWTDPTAISAYTNLITVYDWYSAHLGRDSIDGRGAQVNAYVHKWGNKDNACWTGRDFYFYDNSDKDKKISTAGALDVAAHEWTHAVFGYVLQDNGVPDFPYESATGAINEGYADVFAYFVDNEDYNIGEDWETLRCLDDPNKYESPSSMKGEYYVDYTAQEPNDDNDHNGVHTNSSLLYHAAYLMRTGGISLDKMEQLWYNSMSQGYTAYSDFYTVRRNLIQAAKNLYFSAEELSVVRSAFDKVNIKDEYGELNITFVDKNGAIITDTSLEGTITLTNKNNEVPDRVRDGLKTTTNGILVEEELYFGDYYAEINVKGYVPFTGYVKINKDATSYLNITLLKEGTGCVSGNTLSATTGENLTNVNLEVYKGWDNKTGTSDEIVSSITSDDKGAYSFTLSSGYYTIKAMLADYTIAYSNIAISGEESLNNNISLSKSFDVLGDYRVVLTWGENPTDLDSHLFGNCSIEDASYEYHVYFSNQDGYDFNDNLVANLDVDDTTSYGPETVTFTVSANVDYEYYVDWYEGDGTWAACEGKVEVYNGSSLIYTFKAPVVNDKFGSWKVFTIKNGIFTPFNIVQEDDIH